MKRDRLAVFKLIFVNLAAADSQRRRDFLRVFGVVEDFAGLLNKDIAELKFFGDLVVKGGEMNPKLVQFVNDYYGVKSTRVSQLNKLRKLIEAESEHAQSGKDVSVGLATVGLADVNKLLPPLREIWPALLRVKAEWATPDERLKLPLNDIGAELFRVLKTVSNEHQVDDTITLLDAKSGAVHSLIASSVKHRLRRRVRNHFSDIRRQFGLRHQFSEYTESDLPPRIRKALEVFRVRAPHGFAPYEELRVQAEKHERRGDGALTQNTIGIYIRGFVFGVSKLNLPESAAIEDLLVLDSRPIEKEGKVVGTEYFNPLIEPYATAEREAVRPGWKEKNFDSVAYLRFLDALLAIARFNGEFDLPAEFRKNVRVRRDRKTRKNRKRATKQRFPREWVDAEILRLKPEFDKIIKSRSYVHNRGHLKLCLYLPQLVVLRYLGYRQQCLRRCVVGKNIKFRKDGSLTFYYEQNEIKNGVIINQTFSADSCGEIPELQILLDVLGNYYRNFLASVRAMNPAHYDEHMGRMFFGVPCFDGVGLIKRPPSGAGSAITREAGGINGVSAFTRWFSQASYELMNFDGLSDFPHDFTPHLLRGHCCDWLRKDLGWAWEDIAKAMGDREETLKQEYFEEDEREQSAEPFAKYNEQLRAVREQKEWIANSVPASALDQLNAALGVVTGQLSEERDLRVRAEREAAEYKRRYEFVLPRANVTDDEVTAVFREELIAA